MLKHGEKVTFVIKGNKIEYTVSRSHLNTIGDSRHFTNAKIFTDLGLDKNSFAKEYYGYSAESGDWPECQHGDYEALTRLVGALQRRCDSVSKFKKGDKIVFKDLTKTFAMYGWEYELKPFIGKTVTVRRADPGSLQIEGEANAWIHEDDCKLTEKEGVTNGDYVKCIEVGEPWAGIVGKYYKVITRSSNGLDLEKTSFDSFNHNRVSASRFIKVSKSEYDHNIESPKPEVMKHKFKKGDKVEITKTFTREEAGFSMDDAGKMSTYIGQTCVINECPSRVGYKYPVYELTTIDGDGVGLEYFAWPEFVLRKVTEQSWIGIKPSLIDSTYRGAQDKFWDGAPSTDTIKLEIKTIKRVEL